MTVIAGITVDESQTAAHYTPNNQCQAVFGEPRTILEYTIHWWGDPAPDFDGVVANFCNGSLQTSAHFVAEDGRYACLVSPEDVAWACGNAHGNATTVSIECNPRASDGDYRAVAELVKWLRSTYGDGPLVPHKHWVATDCPGVWDLTRLEALTRLDLNVPTNPDTPTPPTGDPMFFAQIPGQPEVYISNGITYRHVPDHQTLSFLQTIYNPTIHNIPDTKPLGTQIG